MPEPIRIEAVDEIDRLFETSHEAPVFVFKHSLTCPISSAAYREYRQFIDAGDGAGVTFALVEVQRARAVSNALAERTGVRHESPQALLLRGGEVAWHASHSAIREASLRSALAG